MRVRIGDGSGNEQYRICAVPVELPDGSQELCGSDCEPEKLSGKPGEGMRIAFVCQLHGIHGVIDPFEDSR